MQALRILKAALAAIDSDPRQALRSMQAQADVLGSVARAKSDLVFRAAVAALADSITRRDPTTLNRPEIERLAAPCSRSCPPNRAGRPPEAQGAWRTRLSPRTPEPPTRWASGSFRSATLAASYFGPKSCSS